MEFNDYIFSLIQVIKDFMLNKGLVLLLVLLLGSYMVYSYGLKNSWQQMRKNAMIIDNDDDQIPTKKMICEFTNKKIFKIYCNQIRYVSVVVSLGLIFIYCIENPSFTTKSYQNIFSIVTYSFFAFSVFIDIPVGSKIENSKSKFLSMFYNIISKIKEITLRDVITKEKNYYKKFINNKITNWSTNWNENPDSTILGTLILQIKEDYLVKLMPDNSDAEIKNKLRDLKLDVVNKYRKKEANIFNELKTFFTKEAVTCGITYSRILEFLNSVEPSSKNKKFSEIEKALGDKNNEAYITNTDPQNVTFSELKDAITQKSAEASMVCEVTVRSNKV